MMSDPIRLLKGIQTAVAVAVLVLVWLIYPGMMVAPMSSVAFGYILATIFAMVNSRFGVWLAFLFTVCTAVLTSLAVLRFLWNGFDFLSGRFPETAAFYAVPYLFLLVAAGAWVVVALHIRCRHWMKNPAGDQ